MHVAVSTMTVAMAKGISTRAKSGLSNLPLWGAVYIPQQKVCLSDVGLVHYMCVYSSVSSRCNEHVRSVSCDMGMLNEFDATLSRVNVVRVWQPHHQ